MAAFAPIPLTKWSLAVTIPRVVFKKEALAIQTRVVQAVVLTLIFAVAGVTLLTWVLLKPVRILASATDRNAGGDLSHVIPIHSTDELGDLTRSFNRMVKNLARIQNELVRSEKLISLGRLSAGVVHKIRNPLNAMKGAIVYLQRRRPGDMLVKEYTRLVSEEIDRLNLVVTEFLYFAGQSAPRRVATDINRLIIATQQLFEERARQGHIRFHIQLDTGLPEMAVDPHQFEQALLNLIINGRTARRRRHHFYHANVARRRRFGQRPSLPPGGAGQWRRYPGKSMSELSPLPISTFRRRLQRGAFYGICSTGSR